MNWIQKLSMCFSVQTWGEFIDNELTCVKACVLFIYANTQTLFMDLDLGGAARALSFPEMLLNCLALFSYQERFHFKILVLIFYLFIYLFSPVQACFSRHTHKEIYSEIHANFSLWKGEQRIQVERGMNDKGRKRERQSPKERIHHWGRGGGSWKSHRSLISRSEKAVGNILFFPIIIFQCQCQCHGYPQASFLRCLSWTFFPVIK